MSCERIVAVPTSAIGVLVEYCSASKAVAGPDFPHTIAVQTEGAVLLPQL